MDTYRVVVGVDGSEGGALALRWAAREAAARGGIVQAVTALPGRAGAAGPGTDRERAQRMLDDAVRAVLAEFPDAILASDLVDGPPAAALTRAAAGADLLVLGGHAPGRPPHATGGTGVLGAVGDECVRTALCPVVIVPVPQHS